MTERHERVTLHEVSAWRAGLLDTDEAARLCERIERDPYAAVHIAELDRVAAILRDAPDPEMPPEVAAAIQTTLDRLRREGFSGDPATGDRSPSDGHRPLEAPTTGAGSTSVRRVG